MGERLKNLGAALKRRRVMLATLLVVVIAAVVTVTLLGRKSSAADFVTAKVEAGTVELDVSATGTLQAVTTVQVGSQVSGTVSWLGADFKSRVKSGQLVAKLDPAIFQAQVDNAQASLANAEAAVTAAQTDINNQQANVVAAQANEEASRVARNDAWDVYNRDKEIVTVIAARDIQAAQAQAKQADARLQQATAQIGQAKAALASSTAKLQQSKAAAQQAAAQLSLAKVNLGYTIIKSPIDGVVVSRNVDVGQTVAASLQAPTLFSIANDLRVMQVLASIDEADVGQIREGMDANFNVDAFPGQTFTGKISQIRLNATNTQNVVVYTTVIDFSNPDEKLLPGMTANISIPVAKHDNVLMVPNGALRYKPVLSDKDAQELQAKIDAHRAQSAAQGQGDQAGQQGQSDKNAQAPAQPQGSPADAQQPQDGQAVSSQAGNHQGPPSGGAQKVGGGPGASGPGGSGPGGSKNAGWSKPGGGRPSPVATQTPSASPTAGGGSQAGGAGAGPAPGRGSGSGQPRRQGQMLYVLGPDNKLDVRFVRVGITNGRVTEISGRDINEGDTIVIGQNVIPSNSNKNSAQNPFQPRPLGGGGGGGGPRGR